MNILIFMMFAQTLVIIIFLEIIITRIIITLVPQIILIVVLIRVLIIMIIIILEVLTFVLKLIMIIMIIMIFMFSRVATKRRTATMMRISGLLPDESGDTACVFFFSLITSEFGACPNYAERTGGVG